MGLDILPESLSSPRSSVHTPQTAPPRKASRAKPTSSTTTSSYDNFGPHSLPETPRRLSLQINNKENSIVREMESSRPSCSAISTKRNEKRSSLSNYEEGAEQSKSPGYYARQIMKQARETVSRRVGVDITNTINNNNTQRSELSRRDEHLLTLPTKPKKPNKLESNPKLRNSENANKSEALQVLSMAVKPPPKPSREEKKIVGANKSSSTTTKKKKNHPPQLYDSIRNKKDEQFVRPPLTLTNKKCKKTRLSSDLLHGSVSSLVPLNKDSSRLVQKQGSSSTAQPSKPIMSKSSTTSTSTSNGVQLSRTPSQQIYERLEQKEATHVPAAVQVIRKSKDSSNSITEFQ